MKILWEFYENIFEPTDILALPRHVAGHFFAADQRPVQRLRFQLAIPGSKVGLDPAFEDPIKPFDKTVNHMPAKNIAILISLLN